LRDQLLLHVRANLKFFLRNRLVLGLGLAVAGIWSLGFIPFLIYETTGSRFNRLMYLARELHGLIWFYSGLLALLTMSAQLRDRSTRLVFTRPSRPEVWILSVLLSVLLVAAAANIFVGGATFALSRIWDIPYQAGFAWAVLDSIVECALVIGFMGALAAGIHPVLAGFAAFVFSDLMIYELYKMTLGASQVEGAGIWTLAGKWIGRSLYWMVPMLDPFANQTSDVMRSMRVTGAEWGYLAAGAGYAALVCTVCFFATALTLRRRAL
jgi:hypothetical protein